VIDDPASVPALAPAQRVSFSLLVGPVAAPPAAGPPVRPAQVPTVLGPHTPPAPTVKFRAKALRTRFGLVVGSATCPVTCTVRLTVADGRRRFHRTVQGTGSVQLALSRSAQPRRGTLKVQAAIGGRVYKSRVGL